MNRKIISEIFSHDHIIDAVEKYFHSDEYKIPAIILT